MPDPLAPHSPLIGAVPCLLFPIPPVLPCARLPVWLLYLLPSLISSPGKGVPPPSTSRVPCVGSTLCCSGGAIPLLSCSGGVHPPSPSPSPSPSPYPSTSPAGRARGARVAAQGVPPLLRPLDACWGILLPGRGVPLHPLAECGKCALLSGTPPPPPMSARVKHALLFRRSLLLFLVLYLLCALRR